MELDVRTIKIVLFLAHNLPANEASLSLVFQDQDPPSKREGLGLGGPKFMAFIMTTLRPCCSRHSFKAS